MLQWWRRRVDRNLDVVELLREVHLVLVTLVRHTALLAGFARRTWCSTAAASPMASSEGAGPPEAVPPPAAFDELPGPVLRQGWMDKRKPGKTKSYDRRYFILVGRMLLYYKPSAKKWNAPTGVAVLSDGCYVKTVDDDPEKLWVSYESKPDEWNFELKCASATEAQEWMAAFGAEEVPMGPPEMLDFFAGKEIAVDEHNAIGKLMLMDHVDHDADARVLAPETDTPLPATGPKWREWLSPDNTDDVVIVPSLSLSPDELKKVTGVQFYEERSLGFSILQLCEPSKRVVFVTSAPVSEEVVQYYLRIVCGQRGVSPEQARERLLMLSCFDTTFDVNLSKKILARPRVINRIKEFIRPDNAYMVCFISTPDEAELAAALGLDVLGTHPELQYYGTKLGSRTLFAEAGILFPDGTDLVFTEGELATAIAQLWERSKPKRVVVKLNEGFSGEGNALMLLDEAAMTKAGNTKRRAALIEKLFPQMEFVGDVWKHYRTGITKMGALGESWVEVRTPALLFSCCSATTID